MSFKRWSVGTVQKDAAKELALICDTDPLVTLIAMARGIDTPEKLEEFLSDDALLPDPYCFAGMEAAAERIRRGIESGEKITVFGDYDCDGVTATAIVVKYLRSKGADVHYYIPRREGEGYGMSMTAVEKIAQDGTGLIITVDNGIRCESEVARAKELGVDTVVTDHHIPGEELPVSAAAMVDPHLPCCPSGERSLCGAGVALMLISAVENVTAEEMAMEYADLAALGTVADVMPVMGTNRVIIREGLKRMNSGSNPAINTLLAAAGGKTPINSDTLGYIIAPRVNAAGRMGDALTALELFLSDDALKMEILSQKLCELNTKRRATEQAIFAEAVEKAESEGYCHDRVVVVSGDGWHPGVVGIVAAAICEKYGKPAVVLSREGDVLVGSGRSVEGFDLIQTLTGCSDLFTKYGGHAGAAGLTMPCENEDEFRKRINGAVAEIPIPTVNIDCKLNLAAVNVSLAARLSQLEPTGFGNPTPLFGLYGVRIVKIDFVGDGKHTRLTVCKKDTVLSVMLFSVGRDDLQYRVGDTVDLAVNISVSIFKNEERVSVKAVGIRPSGCDGGLLARGLQVYGDYLRGRLPNEQTEDIMPQREEIGTVWRNIRAHRGISLEMLLANIDMSVPKTKISTDVLLELGLISHKNSRFYIVEGAKADLSDSRILNR